MIVTTTNDIQGKVISQYLGLVAGEVIVGVTLDFEAIGSTSTMLMVTAVGTAVKLV
jgi:uncharacterized protein YbjQ (UPF0145 family)